MKTIFIPLIVLLLLPQVLALAPVELVIDNYDPLEVSFGNIYVYEPQTPQPPGAELPIGVVILFEGNPNLDIELEGIENLLANEFANNTLSNGTDFFQLEWVVSATENKTYNLSITDAVTGQTVLLRQISPDVSASYPVNIETTPTQRVEVTSGATENVRASYNEFFSTEYSEKAFNKAREEGEQQVRITKEQQSITRTYVNGEVVTTTQMLLRIQPLTPDVDVHVIEVIPKEVSPSTNEMLLDENTIILEEDPVIMWHVTDDEPVEVTYEVQGEQSITGNTVVVSTSIEASQPFPWQIVLAIALIPLVAFGIFFFSKFEPKK
jgi:hypothetical protein